MAPLIIRPKCNPASGLRQLTPRPKHVSPESLTVIFVPDIQNHAGKTWPDDSWNPLKHYLPADIDASVLGYDYTLKPEIGNIWTVISSEAETLISCLVRHEDIVVNDTSSLIFIAQGLGGLVVKQALTKVYDPAAPVRQRRLQIIHQGTILFGTPNPTFEQQNLWSRVRLLLRFGLKLSRTQLSTAELRVADVADISRRFKTSISNTPVISVYETLPTKVSTGIFGSESSILVDKDFAETGVPFESLVALSANHTGLLRPRQYGGMLQELRLCFREVFASRKEKPLPLAESSSNDGIDDGLVESEDSVIEHVEGAAEQVSSADYVVLTDDSASQAEISVLSGINSHQKGLSTPYYMLNPGERNASFFGREDVLALMDKHLLPPKDEDRTNGMGSLQDFALCGLGGIGKTELAREYAFSRRELFDAIFWIEAEHLASLSEGFATIASKLGYDGCSDADRVVSRNIALEWLSNPVKQSESRNESIPELNEATWLLIFNNADDLELLRSFWPISDRGSILVTSRDPFAKKGRSGIELDPFEPEEAAKLLRQLTNLPDTPENCEHSLALSSRLGGLPLAVTQIAALVERLNMTLAQFITYFDRQATIGPIAKMKFSMLQDHYKHSLLTVWALENLPKQAKSSLQVLSFLNPDAISESLVSPPLTCEAPPEFPTNPDDYIMARLDLAKSSLVRVNGILSQLRLHRLVQDVVRAQMTDDETNPTVLFVTELLLDAWPTEFLQFDHDTSTWQLSEELLPHILKLHNLYHKHLDQILSKEILYSFAKLLLFAGWYLLERSDFAVAQPLFLLVLRLCDEAGLNLKETRADVLFALSALSAQVNEDIAKNIQYAQQHLDCRLELRDKSQFAENRLAMGYGELAHIQMLAGQYEEAITNARLAIEMTEKSAEFRSGDDWPTFSSTHLAFALAGQGRYDEAMVPLQSSLDYWESRVKHTHFFQLGIIYRCIGFVKKCQGLHDSSFNAYVLALTQFRATVGERSHYIGQMCSNLGAHHASRKEYETASLYFDQAVSGFRLHTFCKAQLGLVLYRQGLMQMEMGNVSNSKSSIDEAKHIYAEMAKGHEAGSRVTLVEMEAAVPLSSR